MFAFTEPEKLFSLNGRHLLIQISIAHKYLNCFRFPSYTKILERDTIQTRKLRKSKEGNDSKILLTKSVPTKLCFRIPSGYILEDPVFQAREKLKQTGDLSVYGMIRFRLHKQETYDERTRRESLDFLRLLLSHAWDMRAYQNNLSLADETFFSMNIENLKQKGTCIERKLRFQNDYLLLY